MIIVFSFLNKEGVVSEQERFVDEMALLNKCQEKLILDLTHDRTKKTEEELFEFENQKKFLDNLNLLKPLGLALTVTRNPKETDKSNILTQIDDFSKKELRKISNSEKDRENSSDFNPSYYKDTGFRFSISDPRRYYFINF